MRILLVGTNKVWAIENAYLAAIKPYCEVEIFDAHGAFLDFYHKNIFRKVVHRLGLTSIIKLINQNLLLKVDAYKPTIVLVFKGMEVLPDTLKKIKNKNILITNYNPDHPFLHFAKGSGNKNVINSIGLYDHHFCYSHQIIKEIKDNFKISCSWLPFGYYKAIAPQINVSHQINKICFIGNPDKERVRVVNLLASKGIEVDVFGEGWEKIESSKELNITIHKAVYQSDFNRVAQSYRVQLNIFRPHNAGSHNMRTFEMPSLGCIMLAPRSEEHLELFVEGFEAEYYDDDIELVEKCKKLLALNNNDAFQVGLNAYKRSIDSGYSYTDRGKQVLKTLSSLINP